MKEVEFLKYIIENIVENKEAIEIDRKEDEFGVLLSLKVDKTDMGNIIGKGGNTINSIRSILRLFGTKIDKRVNIKVLD